jgi:hypothetical protein
MNASCLALPRNIKLLKSCCTQIKQQGHSFVVKAMSAPVQISANKHYGGYNRRYRHSSTSLGCDMTFTIYFPPAVESQSKKVASSKKHTEKIQAILKILASHELNSYLSISS